MRVSVLINNYNYAHFVGVAVDSALRQTYPGIEVIVVDDGSRDASLEILEKYAAAATIVAKANGGQGSAYNEGFLRSTGEIVIFLDADDWLYPNAVERIVAAWRPGVAKIQFPLTMVDRSGASLGRQVPRDMCDKGALHLVRTFGVYNSPPGSGNAYAADFLRRILPMKEKSWRIAADTVPILLAPAYGDIVSLIQPLGAYRLHKRDAGNLLMNNAPANLWEEYQRIERTKDFVLDHLQTLGLQPRHPMLLAPWEARVVAMCVRFGERTGAEPHSRIRIGWFALMSLWRWPNWGAKRKLLQSVWMCLVFLMPWGIARNMALKHKASVGLPAETSLTGRSVRRLMTRKSCPFCKKPTTTAAMKCRHCGAQLQELLLTADPGVRAPSTPVSPYSATKLFLYSLSVCCVALCALSAMLPRSQTSYKYTKPSHNADWAGYQTTATDLYQNYSMYEAAAKLTTGNSAIEISGTVKSIRYNLFDEVEAYLDAGDDSRFVTVTLDDSGRDTHLLSAGMQVSVRCQNMTRVLGPPTGQGCQLLR